MPKILLSGAASYALRITHYAWTRVSHSRSTMTKIEAIIRPEKLELLQQELEEIGHAGITVTQVQGAGREAHPAEWFRGMQIRTRLSPKVKVELVVADPMVEEAVWVIRNTCITGKVGDGKVFLTKLSDAVRIRTGERGNEALW